jgi:hypothetical protein
MADEADDVLGLTNEVQDEPEQQEAPEQQPAEPEADEFHIELEGEEPPVDEPAWAKELRQKNRDQARELDGYRKAAVPKPVEIGVKPTLEACDYDEDRFATELEGWHDRKRQADNAERDAAQAVEVRNQQWARTLANHQAKAAALPVKDYQAAEASVVAALPEPLQSALVLYTDDSAKVVYALSKHPAQLAKLSQETDPIKFVIAVRDMEKRIKTDVTRKAPPPPEASTIQRGSGSVSTPNSNKKLDQLEKDAARTGNRTPVIEYKRQLRQQENKK